MLTAKDISLHRGGQVVLDRVSLSVGPGARLGVVGANGIGKTTLLAVLAGQTAPDSGVVERAPATTTVGYLTQELDAEPGETLRAYLARRTGVAGAGTDLDRLTDTLAADPTALDAYAEALDRFVALGGDDFEARAESTCRDVGLAGPLLGLPVTELSGGQAARARLAAILLSRFDVWLLDEPTNDLDFDGIARLEGFLASAPGAVVTVSHDRAFLDRAVERILEIEEHTHRAVEYAGAWSEYVSRRALARSQAGEAYEAWARERRRLAERIRSQRAWSEQGVRKAVRKPSDNDKAQRDFRVNRTEKQASKVRISERALQRLGSMDKPWEGWDLHLDLAPVERSGDVVVRLEGAVVARKDFTLGPVDLEVNWADRIAIMGANGGGKTTLLGMLLGEIPLDAGARRAGPSVRFGQLDQRRGRLATAAQRGAGALAASGRGPGALAASGRGPGALANGGTLLDAFVADADVLAEEARSTLAKFGLTAEHVSRDVRGLSPGERTRAQLAALMARGTNCLVLDEPTNHLDLPAIEQLEAALDAYSGTLLLVTHDRWLLETTRFDRRIEVDAGAVSEVEAVGSPGS